MNPNTVLAGLLAAAQLFTFPLAGYSGEETQVLANDQKPADASQMATKKFSSGTVSALSIVAEKEQRQKDGRIVVNKIADFTTTGFLQQQETVSPLIPVTFNPLVRSEGKNRPPSPKLEDVLNRRNLEKENAIPQDNPANAVKGTGKRIEVEDNEATTAASRTGEPLRPVVVVVTKPTPGVSAVMVMNAKSTPEKEVGEDKPLMNESDSARNDKVVNGINEFAPKGPETSDQTIPIELVVQPPKQKPENPTATYYNPFSKGSVTSNTGRPADKPSPAKLTSPRRRPPLRKDRLPLR